MSRPRGVAAPWARRWVPVLAWAAVILVLTSWPSPTMSVQIGGVDKIAHFSVYGILGWLVGRAMLVPRTQRLIVMAGIGVATFAALDEVHQLFVPNRDSTIADWLADLVGASLGLLIYHRMSRTEPPRREDAA